MNIPRWMIVIGLIAAALFIYNVSQDASEPCIVTATGNEVCGESARAWCNVNKPMRDELVDDEYIDDVTRTQLESTNDACADVGAP